jgi:hypothetical protein
MLEHSNGDKRDVCRMLVGNPDGNRPLRRHRRGKEDNSNMGIKADGWNGKEWIDLALETETWQDLVNAVKNLRIP